MGLGGGWFNQSIGALDLARERERCVRLGEEEEEEVVVVVKGLAMS
jgi:hypothetical protein